MKKQNKGITISCPDCGIVVYEFNSCHKNIKATVINKEIEKMAQVCGYSIEDIKGESRKMELATVRHLIVMVCIDLFNATVAELGKIMNRHHATIINSIKRSNALLASNDEIALCFYERINNCYRQ